MQNIWVISDTHFGHGNILKFLDKDGKKFRGDRFPSVEKMDEEMIENWNSMIKPNDKVYHLGDVYFGNDNYGNNILSKLQGHKRLILGNHDKLTRKSPLHNHFEKIMMWWPFEGMVFSHVPLSVTQFPNRDKTILNVHGHIHQNLSPSTRHLNVCVEMIDYKPVHLDDIIKIRDELKVSNSVKEKREAALKALAELDRDLI